jgi:transposase
MHPHDLLANLPPELRAYVRELETKASAMQQRIAFLEEQFRLMQLKRYAPSSEQFGAQGCLFNEAEHDVATLPAAPDEQPKALPASRKKPGRKGLPAHLPRTRVEHDLADADKVCACCQGTLHRMGEDISEQLNIIPAKVEVLQHVRFKYACRHCDRHGEAGQVVTSPMPPQPIPGSIASPATLATVMTAKYVDGTPLYRLHEALRRSDIDVARTTLAYWPVKCGALFAPLFQAMRRVLLAQPVIHGDETTVQVLKEQGRSAQTKSYMWVYRSALGSEQPVVLFDYQPGRGHQYPQRFLEGYTGAVMTDGYSAWRMLKGITHLGCMAHARRRFDEARKAQKTADGRAGQALRLIAKLYHIEKLARGRPPDGLSVSEHAYRLRQVLSLPILDTLHAWLLRNQRQVLPQSLIGKAIEYTLGQWRYLCRYIDDGRYAIDNNLIERDIRPFATARRAWLFSQSTAGADASAVIYSLVLTCRACNVEPYAYLLHILTELPRRKPGDDVTDLLPFNYAKR